MCVWVQGLVAGASLQNQLQLPALDSTKAACDGETGGTCTWTPKGLVTLVRLDIHRPLRLARERDVSIA